MKNIITIILVLTIGYFVGAYLNRNNIKPDVKGTIDKISKMSPQETIDFLTGDLATKAGTEFDREYLKAMILNHQTEITMAQLASVTSAHKEVKDMAKEIVAKQSAELTQLKAWQAAWFPPVK